MNVLSLIERKNEYPLRIRVINRRFKKVPLIGGNDIERSVSGSQPAPADRSRATGDYWDYEDTAKWLL